MQQGKKAETVVAALLNAYPEGAKQKDNVRALLAPIARAFRAAGHRHPAAATPRTASTPLYSPATCTCTHACHPQRHVRTAPAQVCAHHVNAPCRLCRVQSGRLPLHIAVMQQGKEAELVVTALLDEHPEGAKDQDDVRGTQIASLDCICLGGGATNNHHCTTHHRVAHHCTTICLVLPVVAGRKIPFQSCPASRMLCSAPRPVGAGLGRLARR